MRPGDREGVLAARLPSPTQAFLYEDLGLELIAGALRRADYPCRILDGFQEDSELADFMEVLAAAPERIICLPIHGEHVADYVLQATAALKARAPDKVVVLGGHPVHAIDADAFACHPRGFDVLVRGEGEETIVELVGSLAAGVPRLEDVRGISVPRDGRLLRTPSRGRADIRRSPRPARDVWAEGRRRPLSNSALVFFSRGCDSACRFCSVPHFHGKDRRFWASRELDDFTAELAELSGRYGLRDFTIVDPNFLGTRTSADDFVRDFSAALSASNPGLVLDVACRADSLTEARIADLRAAGLRRVFLGVESGIPGLLDRWDKGQDLEAGRSAMIRLAGAGIYVSVGFIMLHPDCTLDEVRQNLAFLKTLPYFGLNCLDQAMWALHVGPSSFTVEAARLRPARGRVYRTYDFRDPRIEGYVSLCHSLSRRLGPALDHIRKTTWERLPADPAVVPRFQAVTRELVLRAVEILEGGIEELERDRAGAAAASVERAIEAEEADFAGAAASFSATGERAEAGGPGEVRRAAHGRPEGAR